MDFAAPLVPATLLRRHKRFLAECRLADGREVVAHCANTGSMLGLSQSGARVWLEPNENPSRKLAFGWRLVECPNGHLVGVDTSLPNRMLKSALLARAVPGLADYTDVRAEVPYGTNSRVDFVLIGPNLPEAWVEVKSVTLSRRPGVAEFPDAVTERGARHMLELALMKKKGHRAVIFFLAQRTDAAEVRLAEDIDPAYAAAFRIAYAQGVEVLAHGTNVSTRGITLGPQIPFIPPM